MGFLVVQDMGNFQPLILRYYVPNSLRRILQVTWQALWGTVGSYIFITWQRHFFCAALVCQPFCTLVIRERQGTRRESWRGTSKLWSVDTAALQRERERTVLAAEGFGLGLQAFSQVSFHSGSSHLTKVSPHELFSSVVWVNGGVKSYLGTSRMDKHEVHALRL